MCIKDSLEELEAAETLASEGTVVDPLLPPDAPIKNAEALLLIHI